MKVNLRLVGIIVLAIGLTSFIILLTGGMILIYTNPDYNYSSYTGFRIPSWSYWIASVLIIAAMLLFNYTKMKKQDSS